jgi:hypothetical protein
VRAQSLCLVLLSSAVCSRATAQWHLGMELAANTYRGTARDTSSTHVTPNGGPGGGPAFSLLINRAWKRTDATLRISYANPGFALSSPELRVIDKTTGTLYEAASLVGTRVGGIGPSGAVRVGLGPALHLWDFDGEIRARVGAVGAVAYEWPVSSRFLGAIRLEGAVSPSWFDATDVPPEFERRATWRYGVGLGLRYRL